MKVIIINGPMGVGKTTVGKAIADKCPGTAFIDGDWCMDLHPFVGNRETKAMAVDNILHMIRNYQKCSECKMAVLVWLMDDPWVLRSILDGLSALQTEVRNVTLICDRETLMDRWKNDHACEWRTDQWLRISLSSLEKFASMENTIDTSALSADQTAEAILQEETGVKLERMDAFFAARVDGYDEHMRTTIEGASYFYAYTASLLPAENGARVLDLGCGTGLELEEYFRLNPEADVTGIDLSEAMLNVLKEKLPDRKIRLIPGSYFDVPLGENEYDAAVSVESLHHFPAEQKESLYRKLHAALKQDGCFVLTDYFAESEDAEKENFQNLKQMKEEQGLPENVFFHYDTPLTVEHEIQVLRQAGFSDVRILKEWGTTFTLIAKR